MNKIIFSHKAMAKYVFTKYFCHKYTLDNTFKGQGGWLECSTYGICGIKERRNYITDLYIPKQEVSSGATECDDEDRMDYICGLMDNGMEVWQGNGVWCHTHPGASSSPSGTDEETWKGFFGDRRDEKGEIHPGPDFASMIIMTREKSERPFYCRTRCRTDYFPENAILYPTIFYETPGGNSVLASSMYDLAEQNKDFVSFPELEILFHDVWRHHHDQWIEELKNQVSVKTYTQTNSYHHGGHHHQHNVHRGSYSPNNQKKNATNTHQSKIGVNTNSTKETMHSDLSSTGKRKSISIDELVSFLLLFDKENYNSFNQKQRKNLQTALNCEENALYNAQKAVKEYEDKFVKDTKAVNSLIKDIKDCPLVDISPIGSFEFDRLTDTEWVHFFGDSGLRRSFFLKKLNDIKVTG